MDKMIMIYVAAPLAFVLVAVIILYNGLVKKRNTAESAWANIDVQLKRRYDLIPNLVNAVKGYATHEKEVFERIVQLRTSFQNSDSPAAIGEIETQMGQAVRSLFAVAEAYPELKASENFLMLQESLAGTENKIAYSRNNYNNAVLFYNNALQVFPGNLIAGLFRFSKKEFFEIDDSKMREAVEADFGKGGESA